MTDALAKWRLEAAAAADATYAKLSGMDINVGELVKVDINAAAGTNSLNVDFLEAIANLHHVDGNFLKGAR